MPSFRAAATGMPLESWPGTRQSGPLPSGYVRHLWTTVSQSLWTPSHFPGCPGNSPLAVLPWKETFFHAPFPTPLTLVVYTKHVKLIAGGPHVSYK